MLKHFLILLLIFNVTTAGDVLMLVPFGSMSHKICFDPIARELGARGHNVTLISVFEPTKTYPNVNEIVIPAMVHLHRQLQDGHVRVGKEGVTYAIWSMFGDICGELCDNFFQTGMLQEWLKNGRKFDAIIVDSVMAECLVSVAHLLSPAVVLWNTAFLLPWVAIPSDIPTPSSYNPYSFDGSIAQMSLWQRMWNVVAHEKSQLLFNHAMYPPMDRAVFRHFPQATSIVEAMRRLSLILVNGNAVLSTPRAEMPVVVNVGGLHLTPSKPLTPDFAQLVDSAVNNGVVIFSLGTIFDALLTPDREEMFLTAFSKLKYQIIWKYKKKFENTPKNIKIFEWIPQKDLLAHKNIRAFITHAGLLSLQEAFHNQVPTVTLPVFADQPQNTAFLTSLNLTIPLSWDTLSVENIIDAVTRAAEDETLRQNVARVSRIFKDTSESPLNKSVFWMEYIMRHKGAPLLQPAAKELNLIQYFIIDVLLFLFFILVLVVVISYYVIYFVIRKFRKLIF
uniref:UDP-glucuronosyltransferase n=1 Tax=Strigamia maritima TaxID=126957 RepID=A0A023R9M6_STRMM|nr:UDP-glycosyltransferase 213A1 [Strigamia maritima]